MIKRALNKIEGCRKSSNPLKQAAVSLKDVIWYFFYFRKRPNTSIRWNAGWNTYSWEKDGDEWNNQALFCNQPYEEWKNSIFKRFIKPNIKKESVVLEIAPGHGRWTEFVLDAKKIILVDLNEECIRFCMNKFSKLKNINYFANDGRTLSFIEDNSIDFIFSYDSFVHMKKEIIDSYFQEFYRILKKPGKAIIHHAGRRNPAFYTLNHRANEGSRSDVSKKDIKKLAEKNKLEVIYQIDSWGKKKEYNCKAHGDYISEIVKK